MGHSSSYNPTQRAKPTSKSRKIPLRSSSMQVAQTQPEVTGELKRPQPWVNQDHPPKTILEGQAVFLGTASLSGVSPPIQTSASRAGALLCPGRGCVQKKCSVLTDGDKCASSPPVVQPSECWWRRQRHPELLRLSQAPQQPLMVQRDSSCSSPAWAQPHARDGGEPGDALGLPGMGKESGQWWRFPV